MISKIKNKIAELIAVKKIARNQKGEKRFNRFFTVAQDVLIILPQSNGELSGEILDIIRFVTIHKKNLYLIHKKEFQNFLPTDIRYASLTIKEEDKTKLGLPNSELIEKIKKYRFDLVIDLNQEVDIFSSALSNVPIANFRIGFVKNKADSFYNYQIPKEINSEKSYRNLLNSLRMF